MGLRTTREATRLNSRLALAMLLAFGSTAGAHAQPGDANASGMPSLLPLSANPVPMGARRATIAPGLDGRLTIRPIDAPLTAPHAITKNRFLSRAVAAEARYQDVERTRATHALISRNADGRMVLKAMDR